VDAYKIADNERYLRTIPFLQDARMKAYARKRAILISVDMLVITKDVIQYRW